MRIISKSFEVSARKVTQSLSVAQTKLRSRGIFNLANSVYLNTVHLDTNDRTKDNFSTSIYEDFKSI